LHVRHEEAAGFAAAAKALTGELAVCAGRWPGNLHLISRLFDTNRCDVPVLAIAAHIPATEIGGEYFQQTHPQQLFGQFSVYCELASVPAQVPRLVEMAMRAALQRGGVGVVVIPGAQLADGGRAPDQRVPAGPERHQPGAVDQPARDRRNRRARKRRCRRQASPADGAAVGALGPRRATAGPTPSKRRWPGPSWHSSTSSVTITISRSSSSSRWLSTTGSLAPLIARANTTRGTIAFTVARLRDGLADKAIRRIVGEGART